MIAPRSSPSPYPSKSVFSFKKQKNPPNLVNKQKTSKTKHNKTKQNSPQKKPRSCGACPGVWLIYPVTLRWRKRIFFFSLCQLVSTAHSFKVHFPLLVLELVCLEPVQVLCAAVSLYVFASALLCLEDTVCLESPIPAGSSSLSTSV